MTDEEIVAKANELARELYAIRGYHVRDGYRFDKATHPHEQEAWEGAVAAFMLLRDTDVNDALANVEAEASE